MVKDVYLLQMESRLDHLEVEMEEYAARAAGTGGGDALVGDDVASLRGELEAIRGMLERAAEAGEPEWLRHKGGIDRAFGRLRSRLDDAAAGMRDVA